MAAYTPLGADDRPRLARLFRLGRVEQLSPIATGTENSTYRLRSPSGVFVLTLVESQTADEALPRLALVERLASLGLPVPPPRRTADGTLCGQVAGRPAALAPLLPGALVWSPGVAHCRAIGRFLARLHLQAGKADLSPWPGPEAGFRTWTKTAGAARRRRLQRARHLLSLDTGGLPQGSLHGDLFRDNALFLGDRLTGVVDFYAACRGPLLWDLAVAAVDWCRRDPQGRLDPSRLRALIAAYHALRPWTAEERKLWPDLLRLAALAFYSARLQQGRRDPEPLGRLLDALLDAGPPLAFREDPAPVCERA